ncbi:hypothetical protein KKA53_00675 [Candidatus Dependentiae bacterium]|nr:hypothetical protein [Candidatus Dependentiae bacterium]
MTRRLLLLGVLLGSLGGSCLAMNKKTVGELSFGEIGQEIDRLLSPENREFTQGMSKQFNELSDKYNNEILAEIEKVSGLICQESFGNTAPFKEELERKSMSMIRLFEALQKSHGDKKTLNRAVEHLSVLVKKKLGE